MSGRSKVSHAIQVFPFLAVLVCTMGSLIFLLLLTSRQVRKRETAFAEYQQAQQNLAMVEALRLPEKIIEDPEPTPELTPPPILSIAPPQAPILPADDGYEKLLAERQQELMDLKAKWRIRASQLSKERDQHRAKVARHKTLVDAAQEKVTVLKSEVQKLEGEFERVAGELASATDQDGIENERESIEQQIVAMKKRLRAAEIDDATASNDKYQVVPFDPRTGTTRRPILIECTDAGIRFLPEDILITPQDLSGFTPRANPLAAGTAALINYWSAWNQQQRIPRAEPEPYVLMLIRPNGVHAYYVAQRMMEPIRTQQGYELIEESTSLQLPELDTNAKEACQNSINRMLAERENITRSAISNGSGGAVFGGAPGRNERGGGGGGGKGNATGRRSNSSEPTDNRQAAGNQFTMDDVKEGDPPVRTRSWENIENFEGRPRRRGSGGSGSGSGATYDGASEGMSNDRDDDPDGSIGPGAAGGTSGGSGKGTRPSNQGNSHPSKGGANGTSRSIGLVASNGVNGIGGIGGPGMPGGAGGPGVSGGQSGLSGNNPAQDAGDIFKAEGADDIFATKGSNRTGGPAGTTSAQGIGSAGSGQGMSGGNSSLSGNPSGEKIGTSPVFGAGTGNGSRTGIDGNVPSRIFGSDTANQTRANNGTTQLFSPENTDNIVEGLSLMEKGSLFAMNSVDGNGPAAGGNGTGAVFGTTTSVGVTAPGSDGASRGGGGSRGRLPSNGNSVAGNYAPNVGGGDYATGNSMPDGNGIASGSGGSSEPPPGQFPSSRKRSTSKQSKAGPTNSFQNGAMESEPYTEPGMPIGQRPPRKLKNGSDSDLRQQVDADEEESDDASGNPPSRGGFQPNHGSPSRPARPGEKPPKSSDRANKPLEPEMLATHRWGICEPGASIGLEREVRVDVSENRLIIAERHTIPVGNGESKQETFERFVTTLDAYSHEWGHPPQGFFWSPRLKFVVRPEGSGHYEQISGMMARAGISTSHEFAKNSNTIIFGREDFSEAKPVPKSASNSNGGRNR